MTSWHRDYIIRIIEQVGEMLKAILRLKQEGRFEEALREVDKAGELLLGREVEIMSAVDSATAAHLLQEPRTIAAYAELLSEKADLQQDMGERNVAKVNERRALELAIEAYQRAPAPDKRIAELIKKLRKRGAEKNLTEAYRNALDALPLSESDKSTFE